MLFGKSGYSQILDDFWQDLFAAMLNCWLTDEQQWPKNRTHQMFGEWFDLQMWALST